MSMQSMFLLPRIATVLLLATAVAASGCGSDPAPSVTPDEAMTALKTTLDAWKGGKTPESVSPIVVQDAEWQNGAKLVDYQIADDGSQVDANLVVHVKLDLSTRGKKSQRDAYYIVTTSPAVTVLRDMMR